MYTTYREYREARQKSFKELPIYYAFGNKQFEEVLEKTGANGPEDFYALGDTGGIYLKKDADVIRAWLDQPDELGKLLEDYDFAKGAFLDEIYNHEYSINMQADWDVMSCFISIEYEDEDTEGYLARSGWSDTTKRAYRDAKREYYRGNRD